MEFLAGLNLAWTIIGLLTGLTVVAVYMRYSRDPQFLVFAIFCGSLTVYSASRVMAFLSPDLEGTIIPDRVQIAMFGPLAANLIHLAAWKAGATGRSRRLVVVACYGLAGVLFVLALAGLDYDYSAPHERVLAFSGGRDVIREYSMTPLGYVTASVSLAGAILACGLLTRSYRGDRFVQGIFALAFATLAISAINDMLFHAGMLPTTYLVDHALVLLVLAILAGLLREFEQSRKELRARTEALEAANRSLEDLSQDLSESTLRLDRARNETMRLRPMADLGRLSASLAHEIRNPLAVLSNVASTLRRRGRGPSVTGEEYEALVEMLQEETDRLARLVDDLLLFSQSGRISREPVDAASLVETAVADVGDLLRTEGGSRIEISIDPDLPAVPGNEIGLRRACVNLILNAIQSSNGGGRIRVVAKRNPDRPDIVMLGVEDEAGGVPEEILSEIFEPFFSTRPTGTGLGLPIVKGIVEAHGGDIVLENRPGKGASFWMCLPTIASQF